MGTSLSGLTPATTFDGLLKTSDNEPLDGTLRTISDGSGVDSALQLSDSALQVNGDLNVGSVHKIYQDANNLNIIGNSGTTALKYFTNFGNNNTNEFGLNNFFRYSVGIGFTNVQSTARLNVKGSGATSATTSLLVQNSAGDDSLKITDDNNVLIGNSTTGGIHNVDSASSLPFTVSRLGIVRFSVSSDSGNGQIVLKSNTNNEFSVGTNGNIFQINDGANTNQGSKRFSIIQDGNIGIGDVSPTAKLHVKVGANQDTIARFEDPLNATSYIDIKNDPVLTEYTGLFWGEKAKIRSKQTGTLFIDTLHAIAFADGNSTKSKMFANGSMIIGTATQASNTMFQVKGSGATSATTALLVQNSAGTDMLKVTDDNSVDVRQSLSVNHITNASRKLKLGWGSIYAEDNNSELSIGAVYSQTTAPRIILGGKNRSGGADAVLVQALNGMYLSTNVGNENPSAQLHVKGSGNDATTTALLVQNSDGTDIINVSDNGIIGLNPSDNGAKWELNAANNYILSNVYAHYYDTAGTVNYRNASVIMGVGASAVSGTKMLIKGSGATSATTALLVQNSAGTEHLKVTDDGVTNVRNTLVVNHPSVSSRSVGIGWGAISASSTNDELSLYGGGLNNGSIVFLNASAKSAAPAAIGMKTNGMLVASAMVQSSFAPDASAQLQVDSTTKGFLPPRMTTTERDAISTPASGLMVYNTTTNKAQCFNGTTWNDLF